MGLTHKNHRRKEMNFLELAYKNERVEKVIQITEQISRVHKAADFIKYDEKLVLEIPETLRLLGAEIERLTAELKTI